MTTTSGLLRKYRSMRTENLMALLQANYQCLLDGISTSSAVLYQPYDNPYKSPNTRMGNLPITTILRIAAHELKRRGYS